MDGTSANTPTFILLVQSQGDRFTEESLWFLNSKKIGLLKGSSCQLCGAHISYPVKGICIATSLGLERVGLTFVSILSKPRNHFYYVVFVRVVMVGKYYSISKINAEKENWKILVKELPLLMANNRLQIAGFNFEPST